jgi:very-short-patch-repair endonuclease
VDTVAPLAEQQHGVLTRDQALAAGATPDVVQHRLRTGRWEALAQGVYRHAGAPRTWHQELAALTLAAGPGAAASHHSAAALLHLPGFAVGPLEVTTPRPQRRRGEPGVVHRSRVLPDAHLTVVDGIVTTRAARTLVDLAGVLHPARTERAVENCLTSGLVTLDALAATTIDLATKGRAGIALMRRVLDERGDGMPVPESHLEARFLRVARAADLPEPVRQLDVGDHAWVGRVDFAYPSAHLVVELDGRRHHSSKLDLEADRARDNRLMAGGWRVVRITYAWLRDHPDQVVALLRKALGLPSAVPGTLRRN